MATWFMRRGKRRISVWLRALPPYAGLAIHTWVGPFHQHGQSTVRHQNVSVAIWDSVCLGGKCGFFVVVPRLWDIGISALQLAKQYELLLQDPEFKALIQSS